MLVVIEDMVDDELGFIAASRSYCCAEMGGDPAEPHFTFLRVGRVTVFGPPGGRDSFDDECFCVGCGRGPILWDHHRQQAYVLVPFFVREHP